MLNKTGTYCLLLSLVLLSACSGKPRYVIPQKKMEKIMVDIKIAESMIDTDYESYRELDQRESLYASIFSKYKITQAQYDSSLVWYGKDFDDYVYMSNRVIAELERRIADLGDVRADNMPASRMDSVDIWTYRTHMKLVPDGLFSGLVFDFQPTTNYTSGSVFVLGMNVWGFNNRTDNKLLVRMVSYQPDSVTVINQTIEMNGPCEIVLRTHPTRQVSRVQGYIYLNSPDEYSPAIYVEKIRMIRYNYGLYQEAEPTLLPETLETPAVATP